MMHWIVIALFGLSMAALGFWLGWEAHRSKTLRAIQEQLQRRIAAITDKVPGADR